MAWYFSGQNIIMEENFGTRICTELYLGGMNNIPPFFLDDDQLYGTICNGNQLAVPRDKFYVVASQLRERVKYDQVFRIKTKEKTIHWLRMFKANIAEFRQLTLTNSLTSEWLRKSLYLHRDILALTEYNGMISYAYFREKLAEISLNCEPLYIEDFTHTFFLSHRLQLRRAKLQFVKICREKNGAIDDTRLQEFIDNYNCLDPEHNPLTREEEEEKETIRNEFTNIINSMSIEQINEELSLIQSNHEMSLRRFQGKMASVFTAMKRNGYSMAEINDFVSALSFISFSCTEEEYRHYLQDFYWVLLGKLIRSLDMPVEFVSMEGLIQALKQQRG